MFSLYVAITQVIIIKTDHYKRIMQLKKRATGKGGLRRINRETYFRVVSVTSNVILRIRALSLSSALCPKTAE